MFNVSGTQHHESSSVELSSPSQPCANIYIYSFIIYIAIKYILSPAPIAMKSPTFHANLSVVNDTKKKVGPYNQRHQYQPMLKGWS